MGMFPSNQPKPESQPTPLLQSKHGKRFKLGLIFSYLVIVLCWTGLQVITVLFPEFIYEGPVVAPYLVNDQLVSNQDANAEPLLDTVDFYIKIVLFVLNGLLGTFFLIIFVLPKMQNRNIWVLTVLMIVGFSIPFMSNLWSIFVNQDLANYVTLNRVLITFINAPLTWSLILFGYYLYEELANS